MSSLSEEITAAQVSLSNLPERTVEVGNAELLITGETSTVVASATAYATKDSDGNYRLIGNVAVRPGSSRVSNAYALTMASVTFSEKATVALYDDQITGRAAEEWCQGVVSSGASTITMQAPKAIEWFSGANNIHLSFNLLIAKPTWFDANREAGFSVAAQIEDATSDTLGLVKKAKYQVIPKTSASQTPSVGLVSDWTKTLVVGRTYRFDLVGGLSGGNGTMGQFALKEGGTSFAVIKSNTATNNTTGSITGSITYTMTNASLTVDYGGQSGTEPTLTLNSSTSSTQLTITDITDSSEAVTF